MQIGYAEKDTDLLSTYVKVEDENAPPENQKEKKGIKSS